MNDRIDETREFVPVRIALLTISDTRTLETDTSGDILAERIKAAGHELADRTVVLDDQSMIAEQVRRWLAERTVDVIITTGGTGLTGRDVTVEAIRPLFEKEIDFNGDPLLFIESIPSRETRGYVERVVANYWIYQDRMGEPQVTLDQVARGEWPVMPGLGHHRVAALW